MSFVMLMRTFGKFLGHLQMGAGSQRTQPCVRELECSVLSDLWGEEMGWRLNKLLMENHVISHACVMKCHKTPEDRVWRASRLLNG